MSDETSSVNTQDKPEKKDNYRKSNYKNNNRDGGGKRRVYMRRKVCRFCADKNLKIGYKEVDTIRRFITEGGKIIPMRITGNCSKHQRQLSHAVKQARAIALLPYIK